MQGLSIKSSRGGAWNWEVAASDYDYDRDLVRSPLVALPAAGAGGAGRITDQSGTGWTTLALRASWRPAEGSHIVDLGYQRDDYRASCASCRTPTIGCAAGRRRRSRRFAATPSSRASTRRTRGRSRTRGARLSARASSTGTLRTARSANATTTLPFGERSETYVSPKAAIARQLTADWTLKASLGRAVRLPTVAELYQGSIATNAIVNNDPNLEPEKSWTSELTGERALGMRLAASHGCSTRTPTTRSIRRRTYSSRRT